MKMAKSVEGYLDGSPWKKELSALREILNRNELVEELKWGTPYYMVDGKIVVGIAGFKQYFGLWFHQGVFQKDESNVLINAQEGTTRALRQWRFQTLDEINSELIHQYVTEANQNQKDGMEIKPEPKKIQWSSELKEALALDGELSDAFETLTPGKQREYAEHIATAKQEKTRLSRLEKCIPMIKSGTGLHDKYKRS